VSKNVERPGSADDAKKRFLELFSQGHSIEDSIKLVGRVRQTYDYWRKSDPSFVQEIEFLRARREGGAKKDAGDFAEFSETYLHQRAYWHQQQWVDLLESRTPRELHPAQTYHAGRPELTIVNTPPEHAKSTTLTVNYVTYRICKDPNVRIIIVSKTKEMATRFVYAVKNRLTHPRYRQLQIDFAPAEGFAGSADMWKTDQVYLGSEQRDSGEKDPTLLALGIGGQIYGARADLIICDDTVTLSNAHEYEKQIEWLQQEVLTRLSDEGKLLVIGTRVAPMDLYVALQEENRYPEQESPWTYLAQPAVLEYGDEPESWVTLWPETHEGAVTVPKWNGKALYRRRGVVSPRTWAMAYMQQQVVENAIFAPDAVKGCVNGARQPGTWWKGQGGCREDGMDGLYMVAGLDPAMAGCTAAVLLGVDRASRKRYVVDVHNKAGMTPGEIRQLIKEWTTKYGIHEWRIEKNAFQGMLTQDEDVRSFLSSRGCVLKEHHTGGNKWDVDFGVASLAALFDGYDAKPEPRNLIELPSTARNRAEPVKQLIEQLITWAPETKGKTDIVMALWFAEIRAREIVDSMAGVYHLKNKYVTERGRDRQMVVNLDDYWQMTQYGPG
jgi:hypothetical protein